MTSCGANLGSDEPQNYPSDYILDNDYPVLDIVTNTNRIEYDTFYLFSLSDYEKYMILENATYVKHHVSYSCKV